jgi:hypothetical protein
MAEKRTLDDLFKKPEGGGEPCCPKCGGKAFDRRRMRIGYDVNVIYCTACKTAIGVVPAMEPQEMIEVIRREIRKT